MLLELFLAIFGHRFAVAVAGNQSDIFLLFLAWRMRVYGSPIRTPSKIFFQSVYLQEKAAIEKRIPAENCMGFLHFRKYLTPFRISRKLARTELSQPWARLIRLGNTVAFDEKLRKFSGQSAHYHVNHAKPDRGGHQTAQLVARLDRLKLTFCHGLYPFDGEYFSSDEDIRSVDIAHWCCAFVVLSAPFLPGPIVVNDLIASILNMHS